MLIILVLAGSWCCCSSGNRTLPLSSNKIKHLTSNVLELYLAVLFWIKKNLWSTLIKKEKFKLELLLEGYLLWRVGFTGAVYGVNLLVELNCCLVIINYFSFCSLLAFHYMIGLLLHSHWMCPCWLKVYFKKKKEVDFCIHWRLFESAVAISQYHSSTQ